MEGATTLQASGGRKNTNERRDSGFMWQIARAWRGRDGYEHKGASWTAAGLGRMLTRRAARTRDGVWTLGPQSVGCTLPDTTCGSTGLQSSHGTRAVHHGASGVRTLEEQQATRGATGRARVMLGASMPALWRLLFAWILGPDTLFTGTWTHFLANLHSTFECPPIMKIVFREIKKNFYICRFWTSIVKFGERTR
jgi:hypothetical protein